MSHPTPTPRSAVLGFLAAVCVFLAVPRAGLAASASWLPAPSNNNWIALPTTNNWSTGAGTYPGSTSGTTSADIATFNTNSTITTITNTNAFVIGGITFDTTNASAYTIATSGGTWRVSLAGNANGAVIKTTTTVVNRQTITGVLRLASTGTLTVTSDSTTPSATLNITSGCSVNNSGTSGTLVLNGANTGNNLMGPFTEQTPASILGTLIKSGAGTWVLTGANTHHSNTFVLGGTLALIGSASITNSPLIVVSNATLSVSNSFITANSLLVTNGGAVFLTNTFFRSPLAVGTLSASGASFHLGVNGANPYTNIVVSSALNAGSSITLAIDQVANLPVPTTFNVISYAGDDPGPSSFSVTAPAGYSASPVNVDTFNKLVTVTLTPPAAASSLVWVGATNSVPVDNWDTTTMDWVDAATLSFPQAYANPDTVRFDDSALNANVNVTAAFTPFGVSVYNGYLNYSFYGAGKISGNFGLDKEGGASLVLAESGGDDFSGGLTVGGGTLVLDDTNCAISGGVTISGGALLQIGQNDGNGALPAGNVEDDGTLVFSRSNNLTVSTPIVGGGQLVQDGSGTLTFNTTNGYYGSTFVAEGTLALVGGGAVSNTSSLIISNAAFDVSALTAPTLINDFNITEATINLAPAAGVVPIRTFSFETDGSFGLSNVINIASLPPVAVYPSTLTLIQSTFGISLGAGNFNFALGSLPAAAPAYEGELSLSTDGTSVLLTLTNGPTGVRPSVIWAGVDFVSADTNWSDASNWELTGAPGPVDNVIFDNSTAVGGNFEINNVVDTNFTIATLSYNQSANGAWQNTFIPPGSVLTVTGATGVGVGAPFGSTTAVSISGPGELDANGPLSVNTAGGTTDSHLTLDMSGLNIFKNMAPATTMALGTAQQNAVTVSLASNSFVNVSNLDVEATGVSNGRTGTLNLGSVSNFLYADNIAVSTGKGGVSKVQFPTPDGAVVIDGTGGGSARANITLGIGTSGSAVCNGSLLLAGHPANVLAGTVTIGGAGASTGNGDIGAITFDNGTFDATSIQMGSSTTAHSSSGSFTLGGDFVNVAVLNVGLAGGGTLVLGNASITNGTGAGTLAINRNGAANVNCSITKNATPGAANNATLTISDGTLNMLSGTIGAPGAAIDSLNLDDDGTTNTVLDLNVSAGVTNVFAVSVGYSGTTLINIKSLAGVTAATQIPIISYVNGDPFPGLALGSLPAGYSGATLVDNTAGQSVDLLVSPPAPLVWRGAVGSVLNGNWTPGALNWLDNGVPAAYADSDYVEFDDTASNGLVTLVTTLLPGGVTVNNNALNYTFGGPGKISGGTGLLKEGAGTLILDNASTNDFTGGVTISGGTLQVGNNDTGGTLPAVSIVDNGTLAWARSDNFIVPGVISGSGGVSQTGSNVITLAGTNTYGGPTLISGGTVRVNNTNALGLWTGGAVTITNGGTLDIGGFSTAFAGTDANFGAKHFYIAGLGVGGSGAIVNSGTNQQQGAFQQITLTTNSSFGGATRWDMRNASPVLDLAGFKLTKTGSNQISLVSISITPGDIEIDQGILSLETTSSVGGSGTITVNAGGNLGHYRLSAGALKRPITLNGGAITNLATSAAGSVNDAPITLTANSFLGGSTTPTNAVTLNGVIGQSGGSFGLTKLGAGGFILTTNETYTGGTVINAGVLTLSGNGAIPGSAAITIAAGAALDASQRTDGTLTLAAGQTLGGSGVVTGIVAAVSGSTIAPGSSNATGVLTISGNASLGGATVLKLNAAAATNDVLAAGGALALGGTLSLTNLAGDLSAASAFKLFNAAPGNLSGAFTSIVPAIPAPGLGWNTNTLATDGILRIVTTVNPAPTSIAFVNNGDSLTLFWPPDHTGWRLQARTNSLIDGAWADVPGASTTNSITIPFDPSNTAVYFRMVYP